MRVTREHSNRFLYTNRLAELSLLTLAFFVPVASGCTDQQGPALSDVEGGPIEDPGGAGDDGGELAEPSVFTTSATVQLLTGMTYYTVAEEGDSFVVRGYLPDDTERATVVFDKPPDNVTVTLSEPGTSPQVVSLTTQAEGDAMRITGTDGTDTISIVFAPDGDIVSGEGEIRQNVNEAAALLLSDFADNQNNPNLRGRAQWVACITCAGGIAGAAILAWLIYNSGFGWGVVLQLYRTYRAFGAAGLAAYIRQQFGNLSLEMQQKIEHAIKVFAGLGVAVIGACVLCATGTPWDGES